MGQTETKSQSDNEKEYLDLLSSAEVTQLKKLLCITDNKSQNIKVYLENLKAHLLKFFTPSRTDQLISFLSTHCAITAAENDCGVALMNEIAKITKGGQSQIIEFVYQMLSPCEDDLPLSDLKLFCEEALQCIDHDAIKRFGITAESNERLFRKLTLNSSEHLDVVKLQKLFEESPVLVELLLHACQNVFFGKTSFVNQELKGSVPVLLPELEIPAKFNIAPESSILGAADVLFLNGNLPLPQQHKWRFLFSTSFQGESFSKLCAEILNKGPVVIIVREAAGNIFGGYVSSSLVYSSQFQGTAASFLFTVKPELETFNTTTYNDHYAYLNIGQETMPNGLGMGGQHDYFGFWLSSDFGKGHSKAKPKCTTYASPQLSSEDTFNIDALEVWGVGDEPVLDDEEEEEIGTSVIDKHPDAVAILRVAGKERVSEGLRDNEASASSMPDMVQLHATHDPMNYPGP
ncbi:MTOR-associated protein MEAK7-like [Ciona intestinalis]